MAADVNLGKDGVLRITILLHAHEPDRREPNRQFTLVVRPSYTHRTEKK